MVIIINVEAETDLQKSPNHAAAAADCVDRPVAEMTAWIHRHGSKLNASWKIFGFGTGGGIEINK
jgi:hypothetical protein